MAASAIGVVQQWHAALNDGRVEEMVALVHPQVEVGGPRGTSRGAEIVHEWFGRANIRMIPERWFAQDNQVVVSETAEWYVPETGAVTTRLSVATVFGVDADHLITRIIRHESLPAALEDVCMTFEDEVTVS